MAWMMPRSVVCSLSCGKKTRFIMDRGFCSGENLRFLTKQGCRFIIALPGSLKYCTELIRKHRDEIINRSKEGKLGYIRNHRAINEQLARRGFFCVPKIYKHRTHRKINDH